MPFSRSRSIESMTRLFTSWFSRKAPDCHSMASTRVVLPWSTWAMIATLRRSARAGMDDSVSLGNPLSLPLPVRPAGPADGWRRYRRSSGSCGAWPSSIASSMSGRMPTPVSSREWLRE